MSEVSPRRDDEELVNRARRGDIGAQEAIIKRYQNMIFSAAYRLCDFDRDMALDMTQETFLKFIISIENFEGRSNIGTWLYRILVNECLKEWHRKSFLRKVKAWVTKNDSIEDRISPSQFDEAVRQEAKREIVRAMKKLSQKQEMVIKLKLMQGLKIKEIAEILDITEGAVKSHLARGLQTLRKELREWKE